MRLTAWEKRGAARTFEAILPGASAGAFRFLDDFFSAAPALPALGVRALLAFGGMLGVRRLAASRLYVAREAFVLLKALAIFARGSGARS